VQEAARGHVHEVVLERARGRGRRRRVQPTAIGQHATTRVDGLEARFVALSIARHGADVDTEACRATLSTYLMVRDNLSRFESTARHGGEHLGAISSSQSTSDIHHANHLVGAQPAADYKSLRTLLEFGEEDTLRLPLKYLVPPAGVDDGAQLALGWQTRLAITSGDGVEDEVDLLTMTDVKDFLVMRSSYKQLGEVRGGPALALIAHCTQTDATHLLYQEAFITTYR